MKKKLAWALVIANIFMLVGCGGGGGTSGSTGGGNTPIDTTNTNKYDLRTFMDTRSFSVDGAGTLTLSGATSNLTGTFKTEYLGATVVPTGETVHEHDDTLITNSGGR
ncbi:MAG: hypothetical protein L0Y61_04640, partial [Epsilonproteobacteria bacterium]|nr:hypothetical protein [Campylobacterota bacterium]